MEVVAAAEVVPARLEDFGRRWGVRNLYLDYHEMLAKEELDVISVCTRAPLHAEVTIAAAEAGVRGVLCEKAMACSLDEAERMIDACHKSGTVLLVYHPRRYEPLFQQARRLLEKGVIGQIQTAFAITTTGLVHNGTHIFDTLRFLVDADVAWVVAQLEEGHQAKADPGGSGYLQFKNGAQGFVSLRAGCPVHLDIDIIGTEGRVRVTSAYAELWTVDRTSRFRELVQRPFPMTGYLKAALVGAIEDLAGSGANGMAALELGLAFHQSERQGGSKVTLPLEDKSLTVVSV
jgi:predicted dehydrogenase